MLPAPTREFSPLRQLGRLLERVSFNTTTRLDIDGVPYWKKQRRAYAPMLVFLANWYAARIGLRMRILGEMAWFTYEQLLYEILHRRSALACGQGALLLPHFPGRSLLALLQHDPCLGGEARSGLELAAVELARLHGHRVLDPLSGGHTQFSHADATVRNVLVDLERRQAAWIDFETAPAPGASVPVRHAGDLLTLLSTAAAIIEPAKMDALCQTVLGHYGSAVATSASSDLMQFWTARPSARRLAFPYLDEGRWHALAEHTAFLALG